MIMRNSCEGNTSVLILGAVSYNTMVYLQKFPPPEPHTVFARNWHETLGGTGAGKALNLARLGIPVVLHALIGQDDYGQRVREYLSRQANIELIFETDHQGTPRHINLMDAGGRRISIHVVPGTFSPDLNLPLVEALIQQSACVVMSIVNSSRDLIPLVKKHQKPLWIDIHDYDGKNPYHEDFITAADFLQLSSDSLPGYRIFIQQMVDQGKKWVVCTHGADGATGLSAEEGWVEVPSLSGYECADTTGAGDAFFAGCYYGFVRGYSLLSCLRLGTVASGLCVTSHELAHPNLTPGLLEAEFKKYYDAFDHRSSYSPSTTD
jgi:acarbose 7IV-phosphotransferase